MAYGDDINSFNDDVLIRSLAFVSVVVVVVVVVVVLGSLDEFLEWMITIGPLHKLVTT